MSSASRVWEPATLNPVTSVAGPGERKEMAPRPDAYNASSSSTRSASRDHTHTPPVYRRGPTAAQGRGRPRHCGAAARTLTAPWGLLLLLTGLLALHTLGTPVAAEGAAVGSSAVSAGPSPRGSVKLRAARSAAAKARAAAAAAEAAAAAATAAAASAAAAAAEAEGEGAPGPQGEGEGPRGDRGGCKEGQEEALSPAEQGHTLDLSDHRSEPRLAEELVERWISMPSEAVCGAWQEKYAAVHNSIREGSSPKYYITFNGFIEPQLGIATAGMGDYLQGMVTTFLLALVTNRSFIMHESPLTDVVDHASIDWRMRSDVPMEFGRNDLRVALLDYHNSGKWDSSVVVPEDPAERLSYMKLVHNVRLVTNGGILARTFRHKSTQTYRKLLELGLRMPTAFGCIVRYLIKPKESVWRTILPAVEAMRRPRSSVIGIHMRTTDSFAWEHKGFSLDTIYNVTDHTLLQCAKDIQDFSISNGQRTVWLFMSDSEILRDRIKKEYDDKVMLTGIHPSHPSFQQQGVFASALAEWLLLSLSDYFVITESGFAKTAVAYNINSPRIFLYSNFLRDANSFFKDINSCDQSHPTSLLRFSRWSGL